MSGRLVRIEVFLPQAPHFLQPGLVRPPGRGAGERREMRFEQRPDRAETVRAVAERVGDPVVGVAGLPLLRDQRRVLEQAEMAGDAGLGEAEDAGQLGDVEALVSQQPQEPQPDVVSEEPEERRSANHIY